jgi:hypothetical protein
MTSHFEAVCQLQKTQQGKKIDKYTIGFFEIGSGEMNLRDCSCGFSESHFDTIVWQIS